MKTKNIEKILNKYKLYSSSIEKGVGFAKFRNEDPFVARHIVKKFSRLILKIIDILFYNP